MNISFLIPTTSKGKNWTCFQDSLLFNNTLSSFKPEEKHTYHFFIGYDYDDKYYNNEKMHKTIKNVFPDYIFKFIEFNKNVYPSHLTHMWNILIENAFKLEETTIDYFYQCGDDIIFKDKGWVEQSIKTLKMHGDIGITGPINNHPELLTQVFFSRKHYEIFGFLFPEYIFNWGCDDWINKVYTPNYIYPLTNFYAKNAGGPPRYDTTKYDIQKLKQTANKKAQEERVNITNYLTM
jgi:hypothetical protein